MRLAIAAFAAFAAFAAAILTTSATAQQAAPYKLIVASSEGGMVVIDYPSAARCERAKQAIEAEMKRRVEEMKANTPPGGTIVSYGWQARAICIPG